jgi:hypothetical protein
MKSEIFDLTKSYFIVRNSSHHMCLSFNTNHCMNYILFSTLAYYYKIALP